MEKPIIEIKNISKKYNIAHQRGGYVALRDVLTSVLRSPFSFLKSKAKQVAGFGKKEEFWALKDISLSVKKGEVVGVIGSNGAGKSTLLKILSQITPPTEGEIILRGRVGSLLEVGTGFHPELSGRENIFLNGAILGMKKKEIIKKFDEIVEFAGIEKFLDTPVKYYSSGMYVRLAFSVAAHMEPDILLVDEVLAVGDAEFQKKCLGKMDEITKKEGRTILFVSHNMGAIQHLCQRCILLDKGKIKMSDKTKEVIEKYTGSRTSVSNFPLKDRKDRKGTGKIKLTNVSLFDKNLKRINSLSSGKEAVIAIDYESRTEEKIFDIDFSISLKDESGNTISLLMTSYTQERFESLEPKGRVYCKIPKLPLTAGIYYANVNISILSEIVDWILDAFSIEVVEGDFYNSGTTVPGGHSPFLIEHNWEKA